MSRKKADANVVMAAQPIKAAVVEAEELEGTPEELAEDTAQPEGTEPPEGPETQADESQREEEKAQPEDTVYLGPDINDININHGRVFAGGALPEFLEERMKEVPPIKGLIVPTSRYAEVARAVTLPDGAYSMLYKLTQEAVKNR